MEEVAFKHDTKEEQKKPYLATFGAHQGSPPMENPEPNQCLTSHSGLELCRFCSQQSSSSMSSMHLKDYRFGGVGND